MYGAGERVMVIEAHDGNACIINQIGTIYECRGNVYGIKFDNFVKGHDMIDGCPRGYGWYVPYSKIKRPNINHRVER